jgi:hypothetical protein
MVKWWYEFKKVCPRRSFNKIYVIKRKKWRCAYCKYEWVPYYLPVMMSIVALLLIWAEGVSTTSRAKARSIERDPQRVKTKKSKSAILYRMPRMTDSSGFDS